MQDLLEGYLEKIITIASMRSSHSNGKENRRCELIVKQTSDLLEKLKKEDY